MSAIIFISQSIPEKHLVSMKKYKAYLSHEEKENILKELAISQPEIVGKDADKFGIQMHVEIEIREYDTKNT